MFSRNSVAAIVTSLTASIGCSDGEGSVPRANPVGYGGSGGGANPAEGGGGAGGSDANDLRHTAARAQRLVGAAVDATVLASDAHYRDVLAREFDYVTPENATKWGPLAPTRASYTWSDADAIFEFAQANSQAVKGHALVWHKQTPSWVNDSLSAEELSSALKNHIESTLDRYRGRARAWDVVNEAIDTATETGYTDSVFWRKLGPGYIEDAFRWAHAADPNVLLYYNDFSIERLGRKSDRVYALMQELLTKGVPIDGIGLQSHLSTHRYPSEADLRANVRRFAGLGLRVNISEMDVRTLQTPGDQATRWLGQRVLFQQVTGVCATEPGCDAVTLWGFTDRYSWINSETVADDPLIFDREYAPKPAYQGLLAGLSGTLPIHGENLIVDGDFARDGGGWSALGGELSLGAAEAREGMAACVTGRSDASHGLVQSLLPRLSSAAQFSFTSWVRLAGASSATVQAALLIEEQGAEPRELPIASTAATDAGWIELGGDGGLGLAGPPLVIDLKLFGPPAGVDLCIADVRLAVVSAP